MMPQDWKMEEMKRRIKEEKKRGSKNYRYDTQELHKLFDKYFIAH